MRVITCNIRGSIMEDGDNNWPLRKDLCAEIICSREPDVICFQEMCREQFHDLSKAFTDFDFITMEDRPVDGHPMNTIFFRHEMFSRISSGGYWLSETPHVPGTKSWESACIRLCNWVRLVENASGHEFRVINTHLDHMSQTARENQARIINEDAFGYPQEYPQLLTGDMNCSGANEAIRFLKKAGWRDTYETVSGVDDNPATFHEFLGPVCKDDYGKIDWIFVRGNANATVVEVVRDCEDGRYPSDHYFLSADIEIGPAR